MKNLIRKILSPLGLCCMMRQSLAALDTETLSRQIQALTGQDPSNYYAQAPRDVEGRSIEPQQNSLEQIPLTVEYAAKLFFLSFRFSQGSTAAQRNIFYYLHTLHPDWDITDKFKEQLAAKSEQYIGRWLVQPGLPHKIISPQPGIPDPVKNRQRGNAGLPKCFSKKTLQSRSRYRINVSRHRRIAIPGNFLGAPIV